MRGGGRGRGIAYAMNARVRGCCVILPVVLFVEQRMLLLNSFPSFSITLIIIFSTTIYTFYPPSILHLISFNSSFLSYSFLIYIFLIILYIQAITMPPKEEKKRPMSKAEKNKPKTKAEIKEKRADKAAKV